MVTLSNIQPKKKLLLKHFQACNIVVVRTARSLQNMGRGLLILPLLDFGYEPNSVGTKNLV